MSVAECIGKLVATGRITKQLADEAQSLYERSKGEFQRDMGPASAEAAAGLAVARSMDAGAKRMKFDAAKQALGWANFEKVAIEHPDGMVAGVMDQLTSSLRGRGTRNVDSVREDIWNRMAGMFGQAMNDYAPGLLGTAREQIDSAKNLIREIFGASTDDPMAKAAGQAWGNVKEYGEERARNSGRKFEANENWRVPQPWQADQVRKAPLDEFKADFKKELDSGGITRLWDRDTERPVTADKTDFILDRAYQDITATGGTPGAFSREQRTFEFAPGSAGAEAWLRLQNKYGVGDNIFGMLTQHMQKMATEIALSEVIAPNHRAAISAILPRVKSEERQLTNLQRLNPSRMLESASLIEKTYDVLTGRANQIDGPVLSGIIGGLRSLNTAAQLKMALISSIPGDSVTAKLASNYVGMPAMRIVDGVTRELARGGQESKALAARLQLVSHAAMDYNHGYRFFQDQVAGPAQLRWLANTTIRASGLQAWTEMIKRVFSMEFTGHLADHAHLDMAGLKGTNKPLADFLERYGIDANAWDHVRATPIQEVEGARFLDTAAIGDQAVAERLRTGIIQERRFAMLEPDARIRGIMTSGLPQGTFMGELSRSLFLFKSFSMTMAATHVMRIMSQDTTGAMVKLGLPFVIYGGIAGAAALQTKNILNGKDPQPMGDPKFWAQAFIQGTGLGIYGDLLNSAFTKSGNNAAVEAAGPVLQAFEDARRLTFSQARKAYEGDDTTFGAELARVGKRYTPGTWYTKLAVDRLVWDRLQTMIDPDYRQSFRRAEQRLKNDTGGGFWWPQSSAAPERAPNLDNAMRR
jgi:hypothetical protein